MKKAIIQVEEVSKKYPYSKTFALKSLSFEVPKGSIFGVIGMSGAGKSTLLRILTELEKPTSGQVRVEPGGVIFQHFNLFSSRTALENVLFPLEIAGKKNTKKAKELLQLVGLEGKEDFYPAHLSGGEKQRVAIARALADDPKILFSDEATSSLDPKTTKSILELLLKLNKELDLTIFLITHQMEVIKQICTDMAVLSKGEIVEQGRVAEIFASPSHKITQQLLQSLSHDIPSHFYPTGQGKKLIRLSFKGKAAGEPIISRMIKQFAIDVNILLGGIDLLQEGIIGSLIVEVKGEEEEIGRSLQFLNERGVEYEEMKP